MTDQPLQLTLDQIGQLDDIGPAGQPLHEATFVIVDLETTGGSPGNDRITEIGAVKVRGGEVLGELQTLVDPQVPIDPRIQALTGITDRMVLGAPSIMSVLPSFLEFAGLSAGAILVAHNARFDLGFLRAVARRMQVPWPTHHTVDTVQLARKALHRGEVRNHKLATLASYLRASTPPTHRALDDARATTDVLHALLERVGSLGVHTTDELLALTSERTPAQRTKRGLADGLPTGPGVYIFRDGQGAPLYVGKSTSIRRRVRSYFTASEPRARMREMIQLAARVDALECAHDLEAQVRELRLIDALAPRYNRRSKNARRAVWIQLTEERFPRLSIVTRPRSGRSGQIGPFSSRSVARDALDALHDAAPIRRCTDRITATKAPSACALADIGTCAAPCTGAISPQEYAEVVAPISRAAAADPADLLDSLLRRIGALAAQQRFEDAALVRDRARALLNGLQRSQQLQQLGSVTRMTLAAPAGNGRWDIAVVARGRLAGAAHAERTSMVLPIVDDLRGLDQFFSDDATDAIGHEHEEVRVIARWIRERAARLVEIDGQLISPATSAALWSGQLAERPHQATRRYDRS